MSERRRVGIALTLAALALWSIVACTPTDGARCLHPGETFTNDAGQTVRCQTNDGETLPHWHSV